MLGRTKPSIVRSFLHCTDIVDEINIFIAVGADGHRIIFIFDFHTNDLNLTLQQCAFLVNRKDRSKPKGTCRSYVFTSEESGFLCPDALCYSNNSGKRARARGGGRHESGRSWALSSRCASSCSCCASWALASMCASYLRSLSSILAL